MESGNPYIKAGEIAAISLRARRPERERRAGTRAKTFPLPARARASHPAGAQNRPRASQTSAARKKRGFRSFPESQAERSSVALRSQAPLRAIDDKHDNLQPTGAAGPPGQGRKRALANLNIELSTKIEQLEDNATRNACTINDEQLVKIIKIKRKDS